MVLQFAKMNGAGNDFVLMDNRDGGIRLDRDQIVRLCHRQRGVGADGLMLLVPCASGKASWAWDFHNSDGSVAEMCGNGARCFARYVQKLTGCPTPMTFETLAGVIRAEFPDDQRVTVNMTTPHSLRLNLKAPLAEGVIAVHSIDTGVPHAVIFETDVAQAKVLQTGVAIRHHPLFAPKGTNVDFVQVLAPQRIRVRTYERGVEGETLACGTGIVAAALIASEVRHFTSSVQVQSRGGDLLEVSFVKVNGQFREVRLTGPAEFVFEGEIRI
jgi:diaminopimelate epimerase